MSDQYIIPSLDSGLKLLLVLGASPNPLTLAELCTQTGISKTTVFRCLYTLEKNGLVKKNLQVNTYAVSIGVLKLGFFHLSQLDLTELGQPILNELRDVVGYSVHIAIRDHRDVVYVARAASHKVISTAIGPGARLPVYATAVGRMLIAYLDYEDFIALYPDEIIQENEHSAKRREELWATLQADRKNGFAISESYFQRGICTIVYPIFNRCDAVVGVISITIPAERIELQHKAFLQAQALAAATQLSELIRLKPC